MTTTTPLTTIEVRLSGADGNAFCILGVVSEALCRGGHENLVAAYRKEAMAGNYDHLLQTTMKYVKVV